MPGRRIKRIAITIAAVIAAALAIEAAAWLSTRALVRRGWMTEVPRFSTEQIDAYFRGHDPVLGWVAPPRIDSDACVSAYGDSFTAGTPDASYPQALAARLRCDVANFGVSGYGSDQALMLARRIRADDRAPVSVIAHASDSILRNVNQYRQLLDPGRELLFKPRFVQDGAALRLLPMPITRRDVFETLTQSPEAVLTYDAFVARPRRGSPFTLALARWLFGDLEAHAAVARVPRHEPFYRGDHPSDALQLTAAILSTFAIETRNDARTPIILLLPVVEDFVFMQRTGRWPDQPLADRLRAGGHQLIHAAPDMAARLGDGDYCQWFEDCGRYYSARGFAVVAEIIATAITEVMPRK